MTSDMHALQATLQSYGHGVFERTAGRFLLRADPDPRFVEGMSVVCLSYRRPDLFCRLADSLPADAFPNSDNILEKILVNNGGDHETADEAERRGWTVLAPGRNTSFAEGCNLGVREAHTSHVILLNNDCVLAPTALDVLWAHRFYPLVAPLILHADGRVNFAGGALQRPELWPIHADRDADPATLDPRDRFCPWATAACLMVARQLWDALGGFDERYAGYGGHQDCDLSLRAYELGYRPLVAMQAVVIHDEFGSRTNAEDGPNMARFYREWLASGRLRRLLGIA